jgi:hypothetical protein
MNNFIVDLITSNDIYNLEKEFTDNPDIINDTDECRIDYLMYAVSSYFTSEETIKLLIRNGIDLNRCNISNLTALHYSMCNKNTNIINLLIYNGSDINRLTTENKSIYDYIDIWQNYEAYNIIENYKKDKEILDKIINVLDIFEILDKEIMKFLLSKNYYLYKLR